MPNPFIDKFGNKEWYVDGKRHRLDGPAIEWADGSKWWYVNDLLHRLDGPAIEANDGDIEWWVEGVEVSKEEYPQAVLLYKCKMVLES